MSPVYNSRQLLVWSLPTVAVLLGLYWYKRKRTVNCAPPNTAVTLASSALSTSAKSLLVDNVPEPRPSCSRFLTGVDSAPIDIKCSRSAPIHMSDTELDLEIERMKLAKVQTASATSAASRSSSGQMHARPRTPDRDSANHSPCGEPLVPVASPCLSTGATDHSDSDSGKGGSDVATPPPRSNQQQQQPPQNQMSQQQEAKQAQELQYQAEKLMPKKQKPRQLKKQKRSQEKMLPLANIENGMETTDRNEINNEEEDDDDDDDVPDAAGSTATNHTPEDVELVLYEFMIPKALVGRLIGRHGSFVNEIHAKTGASVLVRAAAQPVPQMEVCTLKGSKKSVDAALGMIRVRFPLKRHPELTLERVEFVPVVPPSMHMRLIEGINNDTIISCVVTPAHLFVQQPTHPAYPELVNLTTGMTQAYAHDTPAVPWPTAPGTVCAARDTDGHWHRASIVKAQERSATVQLLDYGGYLHVEPRTLRQIHNDFLTLPFQASECVLANVTAPGNTGMWPQESYDAVLELTTGVIVYTQVLDYTEAGVPVVRILVPQPRSRTLLLNKELVDRGVAQYCSSFAAIV